MKKPVIAIVDDQALIRSAVTEVLKGYYTIKPFSTGETALAYIMDPSQSVDVILLDYEMPGLTGINVLSALKAIERTRDIPVLFLTASGNDRLESDVLEQGAADFITKPFKATVLLTRVRMQLELNQYKKHMEQLINEKMDSLRRAYERLKLHDEFAISLLARTTDLREHETGDHIRRVTEWVRIITQDLLTHPQPGYALTAEQADDLVQSAKLHDIGKVGVPEKILQKKGKLTPDEFAKIKTHPLLGARLLDEFINEMGGDSFIFMARDIALYHHEKWNGEGYPNRAAGLDIPLAARIVALADAYDAITSSRPYRNAMTHQHALQIIRCESGAHFDPVLTEVFLRHEAEFEAAIQ